MFFFRHKWQKEEDRKIVDFLRNVFGFTPSNIDLYKIACTHRSVSGRNSVSGKLNNERLEYLGDAVLGSIIAEFLFKKYPLEPEGVLTEMRSKLVSRKRLNQLSMKIGLHNLLQIDPHTFAKSADGDAFEAVVGAIFLDKGFEKTKKIVLNNIFLMHLDIDAIFLEEDNFKSKLLSWCQKLHKKFEFVHTEVEKGGKSCLYKTEILIDDELMGEGFGRTIKLADQDASEHVWHKISENNA
ncbi:MAG: putative dsRNA-binding protein [Bacteroidales bacterium]|nr:putative dsRNA-binding protein [Bacteroidales bacterium]